MGVPLVGSLRRALLLLLLIGAVTVVILYWQQQRSPLSYFGIKHSKIFGIRLPLTQSEIVSKRNNRIIDFNSSSLVSTSLWSSNPSWTWKCVDERCERRAYTHGSIPRKTLMSCSMHCGSSQLWPQPTGDIILGSNSVQFSADTTVLVTNATDAGVKQLLDKAFKVWIRNVNGLITGDCLVGINTLQININIGDCVDTYLTLDSDERYNLTVVTENDDIVASINATSYFGARHGLETLSQMVWYDEDATTLNILKTASVQDAPRFKYRGLMLDTARNYFSVNSILRTLDGMAASKLNTFHWHVTDSQSFPFDSPRVPEMAKYGSYSEEQIYSAADVRKIVEHAQVHGIRVIMEIDAPAHAGNGWQWGPKYTFGELSLCINQQPWAMFCGEPPCGQLNPQNNHTYRILGELYADLLELSHTVDLFHIGGDEVQLECWAQHFKQNDLHELWGSFTLKAVKELTKANNGNKVRSIIIWSSNLTKRPYTQTYLDKDTFIVQIWGGSTWAENYDLLDEGYRVIFSHVDFWYLDCGFGSWRSVGEGACSPYRDWKTVYSHRPWVKLQLDSRKLDLVLGGEACLWTEQVDEASLDSRMWPRVAAFAERMWSDPNDALDAIIHEDVFTRLSTHAVRLESRGLKPEAMWPKYCAQNPGMCA